ncbi:rRNA (guanine-N1)-methyltransferase [Pseudidiomarina salinarum]|uniref:rRNA (Guanine-N1)-methyltransferase n=2 Tax=Pseudidiomarina salinarum TaxID=435908 RepID=A0A094L6Z7_9GAMM|nr:rRNA (guanine-N1)-methyltransferase [Pseudidiomarina salinarum]RUO69033.1 methyltransferase domain-containing protein [Pseudidiomarina salinarum]
MIKGIESLLCPLDGGLLERTGNSWCCAHGHSFDIARHGYVNLLPVQNKRSKDPGDSKAMVQARQRYLGHGFYAPVADALTARVLQLNLGSVLDAGCGEGYYLRQLVDGAETEQIPLKAAGLDISKWAVMAAARGEQRLTWLVASNAAIPLADASVDGVVCVFGFPVAGEFRRVLRPGGHLLTIDPGPDHLVELKQIIYSDIKAKPVYQPMPESSFELISEQVINFPIGLRTNDLVQDLLIMTPHLYRASSAGRARANALDNLNLTVDMRLRTYRC